MLMKSIMGDGDEYNDDGNKDDKHTDEWNSH